MTKPFMTTSLKYSPLIFLFMLLGLLGWELFFSKPGEIPSALIGKKVPAFSLPNLYADQPAFTDHVLRGQVVLLNVWASWCYACENEHAMLMKIKNNYHVPIYGLVYKDTAENAIRSLETIGNPYAIAGNDKNGDVGIDLGIYGTPETFVINAQGQIIYRQVGAITQTIWDQTLWPLIRRNQ